MAKAKKANPSTKRSPAAQALWRWLRTAGTYLLVFVRCIVYLLWAKRWIVFSPLGVLLAVFLFSYSPSDPAFTFTTDAQAFFCVCVVLFFVWFFCVFRVVLAVFLALWRLVVALVVVFFCK